MPWHGPDPDRRLVDRNGEVAITELAVALAEPSLSVAARHEREGGDSCLVPTIARRRRHAASPEPPIESIDPAGLDLDVLGYPCRFLRRAYVNVPRRARCRTCSRASVEHRPLTLCRR
jgi:hypothetical protein